MSMSEIYLTALIVAAVFIRSSDALSGLFTNRRDC